MVKYSGSKTSRPMEKKVKKWRTIEEFPDYMVSEDGDVYSKKKKIILAKKI